MHFVVDARYIRAQPSGIERYVRTLLEHISFFAPQHQFTYWMNPTAASKWHINGNVHARPVKGEPQGPVSLMAPTLLAPLDDADVFHIPHNVLGPGISCPKVVTVHDLMWLEQPHLVEGRTLFRFFHGPRFASGARRALREATRLIAVSQATADAIVRQHPEATDRVRVIYNSVDEDLHPAEDLSAAKVQATKILGTDAPFILLLGTQQPYKAHDTAIRAFAAARQGSEQLVLVQRRSNRVQNLVRLAHELGVADAIIWRSALPREDVISLLQAAEVLLHPSRMEGFGLPPLEAMACGCPTVVTKTPALMEVVGSCGQYAEIDDVAGLAKALRSVLGDSILRSEMRQAGLERARLFCWKKTANQTLEVYEEAAATQLV